MNADAAHNAAIPFFVFTKDSLVSIVPTSLWPVRFPELFPRGGSIIYKKNTSIGFLQKDGTGNFVELEACGTPSQKAACAVTEAFAAHEF
ncbi:hypothetical protein [Sinorhizobium sp. BG8]|uniref:hypothetical protein n=1 Tax=Sinorhizobium sp. BG8 TaxID=2613773 RepID=UPI00193CDC30|nr:hypothetical protein [Sinorhizobium sp. BG8]QRM57363.1 hypothetical protein F3Y30_22965 [Sinorhizobium sp. BG8]